MNRRRIADLWETALGLLAGAAVVVAVAYFTAVLYLLNGPSL